MTTTPSAVYKNELQPAWGLGLVIEDKPDNWVLLFEHAGRKKFIKAKTRSLVPVALDKEALALLDAKVKGVRRPSGTAKPKSPRKPSAATFVSFDEQVKLFESLFPGGFTGEKFTAEERGVASDKTAKGYIDEAIRLAQASLGKAQFDEGKTDDLFAAALRLLKLTGIVFPMEGQIPLNLLGEAERPALLSALRALLHGEGEFAARLETFAGALSLKDKTGAAKRVTWPFATHFPALLAPAEHVCVKPTAFASQATTLGLDIAKTQPVTADGYKQFLNLAQETHKRLVAAGHKPRDLMDVYAFIQRTHAGKTTTPAAPAVPAA
jgi:hypothetical protein